MASQTLPAAPAFPQFTGINVESDQARRSYVAQQQIDIVTLRNAVDALVTIFNAHTHKTPTTNPGATSTPTSDTGGSGSTGGTATSMVAPANIVCVN